MLSLDSTALNAVPSSSAAISGANASSSASNLADAAALVQATTEAMEAGDDSVISADMSQLASVSASSVGASYLEAASESYGSGSSGSVTQLLQSSNSSLSLLV
jgi:hypothetical protein